jgi:hypothetical protein
MPHFARREYDNDYLCHSMNKFNDVNQSDVILNRRTTQCHSSGGQLPAAHHGGPASHRSQSMGRFVVDNISVGQGFLSPSIFACQYHFTAATYPFKHIFWGMDKGSTRGPVPRGTSQQQKNEHKCKDKITNRLAVLQ